MDEIQDLLAGLEELFNVSDTAFTHCKDLMYESIAASLTGPMAEDTASTTVRKFKSEGYNRAKISENLHHLNDFYYNVFKGLKSKTENKEKHEFADKIYSLFENYNDLILKLYDAENPTVYIKLLNPNAKLPAYAREGDQGADIYAAEDIILPPHSFGTIVHTGLAAAIPPGWALSIRPRSGMSVKTKVRISNSPATIDTNYKDEIGVILDNHSDKPYEIYKGDRIAQFIIERNYTANFTETDDVHKYGDDRGGGYGSTGK